MLIEISQKVGNKFSQHKFYQNKFHNTMMTHYRPFCEGIDFDYVKQVFSQRTYKGWDFQKMLSRTKEYTIMQQ
jgi:hypothetical protein